MTKLTKAQRAALEYVKQARTIVYAHEFNSRTVDALVKRGYLKRSLSRDYNTIYKVSLTDAGRAALATIATRERAFLDAVRDGTFGKLLDTAQKEDSDET